MNFFTQKKIFIVLILSLFCINCFGESLKALPMGESNIIDEDRLPAVKKLAESGDMESMKILYNHFSYLGQGSQAKYWLSRIADLEDYAAQYSYGRRLLNENNSSGLAYIKKAATNNYVLAQSYLAKLYSQGKYVKKNIKKSQHWYHQAAYQSHIKSMLEIAKYLSSNNFNLEKQSYAYAWANITEICSPLNSAFAAEAKDIQKKLHNKFDLNDDFERLVKSSKKQITNSIQDPKCKSLIQKHEENIE